MAVQLRLQTEVCSTLAQGGSLAGYNTDRFAPPASGLTMILFCHPLMWFLIYAIMSGSEYKLSTGKSKKPWIWLACRTIVMTWSQPATASMLATSLAVIG